MSEECPRVITIPAKPELAQRHKVRQQVRVAAYCRVSTDDEEQLTSYEAQQSYYKNKILSTPNWTFAGIFADEGITGTSARKRPEFLRMIQQCKRKKIDLILTKSISRFSRNTVDCLNYIRMLKALGVAVIFEKENINTLTAESEMMLTLLGAFAQAESESISANVRWGVRQAMREGRVHINYDRLYGYQNGPEGTAQLHPAESEVVKRIYREFLAGSSVRMICTSLREQGVPTGRGNGEWSFASVRSILTNEKYCGDVMLQKTFISDCISRKVIRNNGQLPKYLIQNHHEPIVSRQTFDAVQAEFARRTALKSPSKKTITGKSSYTSKYALSERLVCGACGTLYRRRVWARNGKKRLVWRCVNRLDFGKKYCSKSPTLDEEVVQQTILDAINSVMRTKAELIGEIRSAMELELTPTTGNAISLGDIQRRLEAINQETKRIVKIAAKAGCAEAYTQKLQSLLEETELLKQRRSEIMERQEKDRATMARIEGAVELMEKATIEMTQWDDRVIRQLVDMVKVVSEKELLVCLRGGTEIHQPMAEKQRK